MRSLISSILVVLAACGVSLGPPPSAPAPEEMPPPLAPPVTLEWRAAQADGDQVSVTLVVDGKALDIGMLPAATATEAGTPGTCALRAAHALRTELTCGDLSSSFVAELVPNEGLVLSRRDGDERTEVKRVPLYAGSLAVKPYRLPTGP